MVMTSPQPDLQSFLLMLKILFVNPQPQIQITKNPFFGRILKEFIQFVFKIGDELLLFCLIAVVQ